jgi:transcriptional regulator with GAF, ATPase, and Fis domain
MKDRKKPGADSSREAESRAANLRDDLQLPSPVPDSQRRQELDLLFRFSQELHAILDLDELVHRLLDVAIAQSGAQRGIFFGFESESGAATPLVARDIDGNDLTVATTFSRTVIEQARNRLPIRSIDALRDRRFATIESVALNDIRAMICVPVIGTDRVEGALYVDNRATGQVISDRTVQFLSILAAIAATALRNAERFGTLTARNERLAEEVASSARFHELVGESDAMRVLLSDLQRIAKTDFAVMILGESGSGKELVARAIHDASRRRDDPFVVQNCAAIPAELLESELFGYRRGAFTGAVRSREGLFRIADGGTLFLDEVADLPYALQAKLLRVLEDGVVRSLGSDSDRHVNVRLVSATSVDVEEALRERRLRQDLFYRLNVFPVCVPPLRDRLSDIPLLVSHFVTKHREGAGNREIRFAASAMKRLQAYVWPGNVRELEHFVKRALVLAERESVDERDVTRLLTGRETDQDRIQWGDLTLGELEAQAIREALNRTGGNRAQAAQLLGIHRNALLRRLAKLDRGTADPPPDPTTNEEGVR